ncbi:S-layer homology domain-containing protein [Paenibacillaceae bacterium WGS1546]|uniref:S-layer homology domain-containing protein n=1 Tax=Cohnella sp. WGS1546 TaxID=3366810 RepID=UPI00372D2287
MPKPLTGIVNGYEDGSFRPDAQITRAEMASMIAKALKAPLDANAQTGFADDEDIPKWAKGAVEAIRELGIAGGRGGNQFVPNARQQGRKRRSCCSGCWIFGMIDTE